jgi:nucleotide-binding universal stress UspA family protein
MKESVFATADLEAGISESAPIILVPLDFTPYSREAVPTAIGYAQRFHARIVLLHVIDVCLDFLNAARADVRRIEADIHQQARNEFNWALSTYRDSGVPFETMIVEGLPGAEIVKIARDRNVSLIVVGQHPPPKRWSLFHRRTVKHVLGKAGCEVVVVMHNDNPKRQWRNNLAMSGSAKGGAILLRD